MVLVVELLNDKPVRFLETNLLGATLLTSLLPEGQTYEEWVNRLDASHQTLCAAVAGFQRRGLVECSYGPNGPDLGILHYALPAGRRYRLATSAERLLYQGPAIGYKEA